MLLATGSVRTPQLQPGPLACPDEHLADTGRCQRRARSLAPNVHQNLIVARQMLDRVKFIEQVGVERADHVGAHGPDDPVQHGAVAGVMDLSVSLRARGKTIR